MFGFSEGEYSLDGNIVGNAEAYKARLGPKSWSRMIGRKKLVERRVGIKRERVKTHKANVAYILCV